jgi:hypothetical protein
VCGQLERTTRLVPGCAVALLFAWRKYGPTPLKLNQERLQERISLVVGLATSNITEYVQQLFAIGFGHSRHDLPPHQSEAIVPAWA